MNSVDYWLRGKEITGEGSPREAGGGCIGPWRPGAGQGGAVLSECC